MKKSYKQKAQELYKKQQRRINNLRKRGYIIPDLKPLPKRVDKKVYERLEKQLTLESLYNSPNSFYIETNTKGEQKMVSAKRGREIENTKRGVKAALTRKHRKQRIGDCWEIEKPDLADVVISNIERQIGEISGGILEIEQELKTILNNAIYREGKYGVAKRVMECEKQLTETIGEILFYYETRQRISYVLLNEFKEILLNRSLDQSEKYIEKLTYEDNEEDYLM